MNIEKMLLELNELVAQLESEDKDVESSLKKFERGILLVRQAQKALADSEQKVQTLLESGEEPGQQEAP